MARTGYPTPDNAVGDIIYNCVPIVVPDNPEFQRIFAAAIYGLYAEMSKPYFWRELGTMSPEHAALLSSYGLARTEAFAECGELMTCEQVADCLGEPDGITALQDIVTTNQDIINAITNTVNNSGFGNPNHVNPTITTVLDRNPIGALQNEVKPLENCNSDKLWAGIREGIVALLNDTALDLLEDLSIIPNVLDRLTVFIDVVPTIGDLIEGIAFQITELIPDLKVLYESHESSSTLDDIACQIFSIVCSECRYPTFEEIFNIYAANTGFGIDLNTITLEEIAEHIIDVVFSPAEVAFNTISVWALLVLNLQSAFNGQSGTNAITRWASLGEDSSSDNWKILCPTCNEPYAIETWDFTTQGAGEWYADTNPSTSKNQFIAGKGWVGTQLSTGRRIDVYRAFDPTYAIRGIAFNIGGNPATASQQWNRRTSFGTGGTLSSAGSAGGGYSRCFSGIAGLSGFQEIGIFVSGALANEFWLERVAIVYDFNNAPPTAIPTSEILPCP